MQYSANADLLRQVAKDFTSRQSLAAEVVSAVREVLAAARMTLRVMALIVLQFG
jgi:hexokinase